MKKNQEAYVGNVADEAQVKEAAKKQKLSREGELEDLRFVLSSSQGRRVIWRILKYCRLFKRSFTGNSETYFNEGIRDVGLMLLDEVTDADSNMFINMMKEAKDY